MSEQQNITDQLIQLRKRGVPLVFGETSDPGAFEALAVRSLNGSAADDYTLIRFDTVRSFAGMNAKGVKYLKDIGPEEGMTQQSIEYVIKMLGNKPDLPEKGILFWHHPDWAVAEIRQAIWLLRDRFKGKKWLWIGLGPFANIPAQLRQDVVVLPEVLPDAETRGKILDKVVKDWNTSAKNSGSDDVAITLNEDRSEIVLASAALNAFACEQACSLSIVGTKASGIAMSPKAVWRRKLDTVKAQQGCEISIENPSFDDLVGLGNIKDFFTCYIGGRKKPGVVVLFDEIEKMFAGVGTETSGVKSGLLGMMLSKTQDSGWDGVIEYGIPGAGKTQASKCCAGTARVPFVKASISEAESKWVGESAGNLKAIFNTIDALASGSNVLMVATCNDMSGLPAELVARFRLGTFFFDFPSPEENAACWRYYIKKFGLKDKAIPQSIGWVGREIEAACYKAWLFEKPLSEVIKFVIPQSQSAAKRMENIRTLAHRRYLSASYPGVFDMERSDDKANEAKGRTFEV